VWQTDPGFIFLHIHSQIFTSIPLTNTECVSVPSTVFFLTSSHRNDDHGRFINARRRFLKDYKHGGKPVVTAPMQDSAAPLLAPPAAPDMTAMVQAESAEGPAPTEVAGKE
jgi:hypothetical protein